MAANKLVAQFSADELGMLNALQKQGIVVALRREEENGQFHCWGRYLDHRREPASASAASKAEAIRQAAEALGARLDGTASDTPAEG